MLLNVTKFIIYRGLIIYPLVQDVKQRLSNARLIRLR